MDIHAQLTIVRRWLPLLIFSAILAGAAAYGLSSMQPRLYEAKAILIVGESLSGVNPDYNQLLASQRLSATYASIATTHDVMESVIEELGIDATPEGLAGRVSVATSTDTALLTVTARDTSAPGAAAIANAVARGLIAASPAVSGQQEALIDSVEKDIEAIRTDIAATQAQIEELLAKPERTPAEEATLQTLQNRIVSLRSTYATLLSFTSNQATNLLTIVQPALTPTGWIAPRPVFDTVVAATIAFLLVAALVFIFEYLDDAVRNPDQVFETLGLPTLGTIETMRGGKGRRSFYRLAALLNPRSRTAEAYRTIRTNLEFASIDRPLRSLLVASALPGEGKTVTAANLALVVAQAGRRVMLIDADFRKPGLHDIFDLSNTHGLTDLIRNPNAIATSLVQTTEQPDLHILTTGPVPPNPAEILGSQRTRTLLGSLASEYDLLIIDSPPIGLFADAPLLSSYVDGTLLVVEAHRGRRPKLRHGVDALVRAGATIVGVVINRASSEPHATYGYYLTRDAGPASDAAATPGVAAAATAAPTTGGDGRATGSQRSGRDGARSGAERR